MFFLSFNEAAILDRDFNSVPSQQQNIIVFAANNSRCCECRVAPTIPFCFGLVAPTIILNVSSETISSVDSGHHKVHILYLEYHSVFPPVRTGSPPPPLPQTSVSTPPNHKKCAKIFFCKHW
jgi:hypothetical protein